MNGTSANARTEAIINAPVARTICRLTAPMIGGIIALMILSIVDAYFIGQLGLNQLAALGFTLPITQGANSMGSELAWPYRYWYPGTSANKK